MALLEVQWPLLGLRELLAVIRGPVRGRAADVVVVQGLVSLVIGGGGGHGASVEGQTLSRLPCHPLLLLLHAGALAFLQESLHAVPVPVDQKQGEAQQGHPQEDAHDEQLVPVGSDAVLHGPVLAVQEDVFVLGDEQGCGPGDGGGGGGGGVFHCSGLCLHAVVGKQLPEPPFDGPAFVSLPLLLCVSHHHQAAVRADVSGVTGTRAVDPLPSGQVRPQLTGQDFESVGR